MTSMSSMTTAGSPATRARPPALLLLLPLLALTACGTVTATGSATGTGDVAARLRAMGSARSLVYVTDVAGYDLARQSVGVHGDDGFQSTYYSTADGGQIQLTVDRGTLDAANCPATPIDPASGDTVRCEREGADWYRATADAHEYAVSVRGHVLRLTAKPLHVSRATLRKAARAAHHAGDRELDALLPELPAVPDRTTPVERGDLPSSGDGAPNNEVGVGG